MKKILFLLALVFAICSLTQAQSTKKITTGTITDTSNDTLEFKSVPDNIVGLQATLDRLTGSVTGKIYLDGAIISGDYVLIDSLTVVNAAKNTKVFAVPRSAGTTYLSYRFRFNCSGTQTSVGTAAYLRRSNE